MTYTLDNRLKESSFHLLETTLCDVRLKINKHFPWIILIPRVDTTITEIHHLSETQQQTLMHEISMISKAMDKQFSPDKINVGAIGNIVTQMHIHIIARFKNDLMWPHSLWQADVPESAYDDPEAVIADYQQWIPTALRASE